MKRISPLTAGAALLVAVLACSDNGNTGPEPTQDADFSGTWDVVMTVTGGNQLPAGTEVDATLTVSQTGNTCTGTFNTEQGLGGQITGTVSGNTVSLTLNQGPPCPGTYTGSATLSGNTVTGSYSGTDCFGTIAADFTGTRR